MPAHKPSFRFILTSTMLAALLLTDCTSRADPPPASTSQGSQPSLQLAPAQTPAVDDAIRARVETWLTLVAPGATASAQDYADFLSQGPHWPERGLMLARYQKQLATIGDTNDLARLCPLLPLTSPLAFQHCAPYLSNTDARARALWIGGIDRPEDENPFLAAFGHAITPTDQWRRFERQEQGRQYTAARRQIARLAVDRQPLARARLAYRLTAADADQTLGSLSAADRADPDLIQAELHALRRADRLGDALALWKAAGTAAQQASPSTTWSNERAALARNLLLAGSPQDALFLADDRTRPPGSRERLEAQFLTGWIKLRYLHDPAGAVPDFTYLLQDRSLITRSRGAYWLGRAHDALGHADTARKAYVLAGTMPTTFYGQLALAALHDHHATLLPGDPAIPDLGTNLAALREPDPGALPRPDLVQAAEWLAGIGDIDHARIFLMMLHTEISDPAGQATLATLSARLGILEPAVFAARAAGRQGVPLFPQGWPRLPALDEKQPDDTLPPGLALGVARQESSFDPHAVSPAQAIGLMQFQTGTARDVARRAGLTGLDTSAQGLRDPQTNMTLGRAYLSQLLSRYGNVVPEALAAYNAGPHRADLWLQADPLPATLTQDDLIDWIEKLPYEETRSYIQRIEESMAIYRWQEEKHAG